MIKYKTFIIKTFDQVKNDNFDQVKFDQPTPCQMGNTKKKLKKKNMQRKHRDFCATENVEIDLTNRQY